MKPKLGQQWFEIKMKWFLPKILEWFFEQLLHQKICLPTLRRWLFQAL